MNWRYFVPLLLMFLALGANAQSKYKEKVDSVRMEVLKKSLRNQVEEAEKEAKKDSNDVAKQLKLGILKLRLDMLNEMDVKGADMDWDSFDFDDDFDFDFDEDFGEDFDFDNDFFEKNSFVNIGNGQTIIMTNDTPGGDTLEYIRIGKPADSAHGGMEIIIKDKSGNVQKYEFGNTWNFNDSSRRWNNRRTWEKGFTIAHNMRPERKRVETKWFLVDLGLNGLIYKGSASLPPTLSALELETFKSVHVNVGIVAKKIRLDKNGHISAIVGVNYDNNDYRFQNNISLVASDSSQTIQFSKMDPELKGFVRNKLTTRFLSVPVSFHYDSRPDQSNHSFHIEAGVQAGYRLTSFFKTVRQDEGKRKTKDKDDFFLNNFRYGAFAKVGYGKFTLYGSYIFTPLFREGTGPELNTFSFGISLGDFN